MAHRKASGIGLGFIKSLPEFYFWGGGATSQSVHCSGESLRAGALSVSRVKRKTVLQGVKGGPSSEFPLH